MNIAARLLEEAANAGIVLRALDGHLSWIASLEEPQPQLLTALKRQEKQILKHFEHYGMKYAGALAAVESVVPMAPLKSSLYYEHLLDPDGLAYNMGFLVRARGVFDQLAWEQAWRHLLARHCDLRSTYVDDEGSLNQLVLSPPPLPLQHIDLRSLPEDGREAAAAKWMAETLELPFNLQAQLPMRLAVITLDSRMHLLAVCLHHIAADADSLVLLIEELREHYCAVTGGADREVSTMSDIVCSVRHNAWTHSSECARQVRAWCDELRGVPWLFQPGPASTARKEFKRIPIHLPRDLVQTLAQNARSQRLTAFHLVLAAFARAVSIATGHDDLIIGAPVRASSAQGADRVIGCFANLLPIRLRPLAHANPQMLLLNVRARTQSCLLRRDVPLRLIRHALSCERAPLPEIQAVMTFVTQDLALKDWPQLQFEQLEARALQGKFPLNAQLSFKEDILAGHIEIATDILQVRGVAEIPKRFELEMRWLAREARP